MSALESIVISHASGSLWRDHSDEMATSPCALSLDPPLDRDSFHLGSGALGDAIANLLSDGSSSSDRSSDSDSPAPDTLPSLDYELSPAQSWPGGYSPDEERDRRRYRRSPKPALDLRQQRAIIDAEKATKREEYHRQMAERTMPTGDHSAVSAMILCNEAHRRHYNQAKSRGGDFTLGTTHCVISDSLEYISAAWNHVAECVQDSLFHPGAVQGRLSCMGIFRNDMKVSDLISFDNHEDERSGIRQRQQQIINALWQQAMDGGNPVFLEGEMEVEVQSPTAFINIGDYC
eukprot:GDKK01041871.1.p1 GENE.GDKK01041871.1~~GDKK01041871.1.p1  ORF type:complete len:290 (+),score=9.74 GDKK01041871.1:49-918(+)